MNEDTKNKLKLYHKRKCNVCDSQISYRNPLTKCSSCNDWFCYDHITGVLEKKGIEDYCDKCLKK
jgi:hypothetical protein